MSFLRELQRRNVGRVATAYIVASWLIVQVADTVLLNFDVSERVFQVLVIVLAIGFVPTVVMSWLFEWTPEGLKRDEEAEQAPGSRLARARRLDRGIIVVLLIAVSYFAVDKFVFTATDSDDGYFGERSIAVMPFEVNSENPDHRYFINGVTDEIRNLLQSVRPLRVIAETSSTHFHERNLTIAEMRADAAIGHLLEGSMRMVGNRVRVSARLVETRTETQLWSDVFEREIDDVFRIQDDIARNVLHQLEITLEDSLPPSYQVDPEVHMLLQQAKEIYQVHPPDMGEQMYPLTERAYELAPDYPESVEWMINAEYVRGYTGIIPMDEARRRWEALEARLAELDPDTGVIDANRAFDHHAEGEFELAAPLYMRAMEKELTDSEMLRWAGALAQHIGNLDVAIRILELAVARDPVCYQCGRKLSQILMYRGDPGDYRSALTIRERYREVGSGGQPDYSMMLILLGQPELVADVWADKQDDHHQAMGYLAMADHSMGNAKAADAKLARLEELLAEATDAVEYERQERDIRETIAEVAAWMGDADKAFHQLNQIAKSPKFFNRGTVFHPVWREIRDDPRWLEYREAIGMSQERLDAIEFDPWLPE